MTTMPLIITAHEKSIMICEAGLRIIAERANVSPSVAIHTTYQKDNSISTFAYLPIPQPELEELIEGINASDQEKIVSTKMQHEGYTVVSATLLSYFSPENLKNALVQYEKKLLEATGYNNLKEGTYFAFPIPSDQDPYGVFFAFARTPAEAESIENAKDKIVEDFKKQTL